jgi:D-sedoheptulose 7-phosphate isomerase
MTTITELQAIFEHSIAVKQQTMATLLPAISCAGNMLTGALSTNRKILSCGNGGSAADSQHFAAELVNRFETERKGLAAMSLTTDTSTLTSVANDYSFNQVFTRQILALGNAGDILFAISTSGNSANIVEAIKAAQTLNMKTIALTGGTGGKISALLGEHDLEIRVPANATARVQETHILIIHCLCHIIDQFFSKMEHTS